MAEQISEHFEEEPPYKAVTSVYSSDLDTARSLADQFQNLRGEPDISSRFLNRHKDRRLRWLANELLTVADYGFEGDEEHIEEAQKSPFFSLQTPQTKSEKEDRAYLMSEDILRGALRIILVDRSNSERV